MPNRRGVRRGRRRDRRDEREEFDAWRAIAQETSYKAFSRGNADGQQLLDMALAVE
jgi:hypothetical protein